jgi:predicted TIM-barrel fold metal-dependent hydrolase
MPRELPPKVDVHAHFLPADYREALLANGHERPDGFPILPEWSPEGHLEVLDRLGIGTAMLSVSSPGVALGEDAAAWARSVNETGAATVRAHPDRFGLLASLPLPDVDAALAELRHAFDRLGADGIALLTNVDGVYLGDERYEPLASTASTSATSATSRCGQSSVAAARSYSSTRPLRRAGRRPRSAIPARSSSSSSTRRAPSRTSRCAEPSSVTATSA